MRVSLMRVDLLFFAVPVERAHIIFWIIRDCAQAPGPLAVRLKEVAHQDTNWLKRVGFANSSSQYSKVYPSKVPVHVSPDKSALSPFSHRLDFNVAQERLKFRESLSGIIRSMFVLKKKIS